VSFFFHFFRIFIALLGVGSIFPHQKNYCSRVLIVVEFSPFVFHNTCSMNFSPLHSLCHLFHTSNPPTRWFWPAYGIYMAGAVAMGYMSFKRPACDIFIAGITQFPTTFYCLCALGLRKWPRVTTTSTTIAPVARGSAEESSSYSSSSTIRVTTSSPVGYVRLVYRIMYYIGFIGNAPLLPMYPLLVQYSGMSLAGINTLLHSWLMIMWGMQGISLLHLINAIDLHLRKVSKD
jgi:hypothetical protein